MRITPKYVNLPKPGKKYGNIKTAEDKSFAVLASMTGRFVSGNEYQCTVEDQKWGDNLVQVVTEMALVGAPVAPANGPADRWYMPFVSNTVAHAIQAGLIKQVGDIAPWARQAYLAARGIDKPFAEDDIDF